MDEKDTTQQPAYPSTGDYAPPKKRRYVRHIVLFSALFLLLGGALYVVRTYDFEVKNVQGSLSFSIDKKEEVPTTSIVEPVAVSQETHASDLIVQREYPVDGPQLNLSEAEDCDALSLSEIYEKAIVSVVSIVVNTPTGVATGSGIIMTQDGYIITNYHVIEQAYAIEVLLYDDTILTGSLVGCDDASDLAVLKVDATDLVPAEFGDSDQMSVGDAVVAIGNPLGLKLRGTMTDGIISAINRDLDVQGRTITLMQTNATLNSGNSGGPLLNCYGQVIAINTPKIGALYAEATVEGLGFAIPIATAKPIIDQLINEGFVEGQPSLGLELTTLTPMAHAYFRLPKGLYIEGVVPYSDAYEKGVEAGDLLLSIDGVTLDTVDTWYIMKGNYAPGDTVMAQIYHEGVTREIEIQLIDQNQPVANG